MNVGMEPARIDLHLADLEIDRPERRLFGQGEFNWQEDRQILPIEQIDRSGCILSK